MKKFLALEEMKKETQRETELTMYGFIQDLNELKKADFSTNMIQLQAVLGRKERCRCRSSYNNSTNKQDYIFTIKSKAADSDQLSIKEEHNFVVDSAFFEHFLTTADSVQNKVRYTFTAKDIPFILTIDGKKETIKVPEMLFEIDVFIENTVKSSDNNLIYSKWCKIDVELDSTLKYIDDHYKDISTIFFPVNLKVLPVVIKDAFIEKDATSPQKQLTDRLWKQVFSKEITNG